MAYLVIGIHVASPSITSRELPVSKPASKAASLGESPSYATSLQVTMSGLWTPISGVGLSGRINALQIPFYLQTRSFSTSRPHLLEPSLTTLRLHCDEMVNTSAIILAVTTALYVATPAFAEPAPAPEANALNPLYARELQSNVYLDSRAPDTNFESNIVTRETKKGRISRKKLAKLRKNRIQRYRKAMKNLRKTCKKLKGSKRKDCWNKLKDLRKSKDSRKKKTSKALKLAKEMKPKRELGEDYLETRAPEEDLHWVLSRAYEDEIDAREYTDLDELD